MPLEFMSHLVDNKYGQLDMMGILWDYSNTVDWKNTPEYSHIIAVAKNH